MFGRYHRYVNLTTIRPQEGACRVCLSHSPRLVEHACCILIFFYLLPQNSELLNIKMVLNQTTKVSFPKHNVLQVCLYLFTISSSVSHCLVDLAIENLRETPISTCGWREKGIAAFAEQFATLQPPAHMSSAFSSSPSEHISPDNVSWSILSKEEYFCPVIQSIEVSFPY